MPEDANDAADESTDTSWISRRKALSTLGVGAGLAALGGAGTVLGQTDGEDESPTDDGTETATETDGNDGESDSDDVFLDDLIDPTFGYPLAAEETGAVDAEYVVEATIVDGQGAHENFPSEPDESAPGSFVEIPAEFFFDPVGLHVEPGDLVHFRDVGGLHTVTAFHELADPNLEVPRRIPDEVPPFTSPPLTPGQSWVYQFTEKGVYDYLCLPHLGLGMVGRIVVFDPAEDDLEDELFQAPTEGPLFSNDERVLGAEELVPATIVEEGTVSWDSLTISEPTATETETETEEV